MPPRTRRSHLIDAEGQLGDRLEDNNSPLSTSKGTNTASGPHVVSQRAATGQRNNLNKSNKRTLSVGANESTDSVAQAIDHPPKKKARNTKSDLTGGDGRVQQQGQQAAHVARDNPMSTAPSFYPGCCTCADRLFSPQPLEASEVNSCGSDEDDNILESENDWLDDQEITELSQKEPSKISNMMMLERPSWRGLADTAGPSSGSVREQAEDVDVSHGDGKTATTTWPTETEIIVGRSNKVMLSSQHPVIQNVIQDAINNLRISLLFENAFPDATDIPSIIEKAILTAAENRIPDSNAVYTRLMCEKQYMFDMRRLVKDRVNVVVFAAFGSMNPDTISETVERQITDFTYIFPTGKSGRTQPYRNEWIISVIHQLYFSGGSLSLANKFKEHFPISKDRNGEIVQEIPMPMVALVATAIYATLNEWQTGKRQPVEFSANTFLDSYYGHILTLKSIQEKRNRTFHTMMADIYSRARGHINIMMPTVPMANLNLDALED